ncbi:MAG: Panacea domain-containing protein [Bacteroidales bacterium]|jgi:uncharacterized phage-associated protein|nr:Panacea domain-containing protein [Bacteroidales bacterium]
MKQQFDFQKAIDSVKLILANMEQHTADFHKVFKILYFAEQKHLVRFGRNITGDRYIAMKNGPVPSGIYDVFKVLKGDCIMKINADVDFSKHFRVVDGYYIQLIDSVVDLDYFSQSEIECLTESVSENKMLDFSTLTRKSHDNAWKHTGENDEISVFQMAHAAGANEEMIKYISLSIENAGI